MVTLSRCVRDWTTVEQSQRWPSTDTPPPLSPFPNLKDPCEVLESTKGPPTDCAVIQKNVYSCPAPRVTIPRELLFLSLAIPLQGSLGTWLPLVLAWKISPQALLSWTCGYTENYPDSKKRSSPGISCGLDGSQVACRPQSVPRGVQERSQETSDHHTRASGVLGTCLTSWGLASLPSPAT